MSSTIPLFHAIETMQVYKNANLKPFHTFSIDASCDVLIIVESLADLIEVYQSSEWSELPKLVLGKGSNVIFVEHFHGVVIVNRIMGIAVTEMEGDRLLHVNGGEDWPELVEWSLNQGYGGLENLALIPGCAGSAPIQNIGAYGVELKDVCEYVDVLMLATMKVERISAEKCQFGYRDSVFKHELHEKAVIVAIGIKLACAWQPKASYGALSGIPKDELTPNRVFQEVCRTRIEKLPDPELNGNAGSFFKNPVIDLDHYNSLLARFPDLVAYPSGSYFKLAAGWLIDQCGLKGERVGGAKVHTQQALVIVNDAGATAQDVIELAKRVASEVYARYQVELEPEVRFINKAAEMKLNLLNELVG